MNKRFIYLFATIFLVALFYFKTQISQNIIYLFNQTKLFTNSQISSISDAFNNHFSQAEQIKHLSQQNKQYKDYIEQIKPFLLNINKLSHFKNLQIPSVHFAQTISYAKLPNIDSIYINYHENNLTSPRGLIYNNQTAGIVAKSLKASSLVYLNNNPNTSYTVFISDAKIPGIFFGGKNPIIKYIPKYTQIKKGDKVITSGLDGIFYEGIMVGEVSFVITKKLYKEVYVNMAYDPLHPDFFYVIKDNK